jgi:hypothetical protein
LAQLLPLLGNLPERAALAVEVSKYLPSNQSLPSGLRIASILYRLRLAVYAISFVAVLTIGGGLVYGVAKIVGSLAVLTEAKDAANHSAGKSPEMIIPGSDAVAAVGSEAGLPPEKVWLAEQGEGYEFYSNGARILTEFETAGPLRRFYRFDMEGDAQSSEASKTRDPAGIVYHLSEGDQLPFGIQYNSSLNNASRALIEYARQHLLYNYLIDRFGRIYRIVPDEMAANHAGKSLWSDGESVYINLSASFIGICLEGRSAPRGVLGPEGINEAQIYAARVLTAVLRSRYAIQDASCVTHGLVSLNPSNQLLGYHTDWLTGFPFEAVGLINKSETNLVAISHFGFTYDQQYLASAGGKRWPGLERAEEKLKEMASNSGVSVEQQRRLGRALFQRAYEKQRALDVQLGQSP